MGCGMHASPHGSARSYACARKALGSAALGTAKYEADCAKRNEPMSAAPSESAVESKPLERSTRQTSEGSGSGDQSLCKGEGTSKSANSESEAETKPPDKEVKSGDALTEAGDVF